MLFGLDVKWTIPFVVLCAVNAVIVIAEYRIRRAADDTVGLNLHG